MSFLTRMLAASNDRAMTLEHEGALLGIYPSAAGVSVTPETALKLSAVWACTRLLSETIASLPAIVYERLPNGGRERATQHPLYDVLHQAPNDQQTPAEFFDFMTHCVIMRGNGYARILPGPRGFADQLRPIHPDYVSPRVLSGGRMEYLVNEPGEPAAVLGDGDILHVRGMSADGRIGQSFVTYARESLGLGLAAERYGARYFRNSAQPRGVLKSSKPISPEAARRLKESWDAAHAGDNQHRIAVLEDGLEYQAVGLSNKDSQFLELREFGAEDVCRWIRVPPHMIGLTSKATSWGSGIEQMGIGFVVYTLMPWLVRWQQAITRDLILAPRKYFVEFLVDALLRGDIKTRYDAYRMGRGGGWLSRNEIRMFENMNPIPGGDDYLTPLWVESSEDVTNQGQRDPNALAALGAAAGRVLRKEAAALKRSPKAVAEFWNGHAEFVARAIGIPPHMALDYVSRQQANAAQAQDFDDWEERHLPTLIGLALEGQTA